MNDRKRERTILFRDARRAKKAGDHAVAAELVRQACAIQVLPQ
jgi:hypothetical protein